MKSIIASLRKVFKDNKKDGLGYWGDPVTSFEFAVFDLGQPPPTHYSIKKSNAFIHRDQVYNVESKGELQEECNYASSIQQFILINIHLRCNLNMEICVHKRTSQKTISDLIFIANKFRFWSATLPDSIFYYFFNHKANYNRTQLATEFAYKSIELSHYATELATGQMKEEDLVSFRIFLTEWLPTFNITLLD